MTSWKDVAEALTVLLIFLLTSALTFKIAFDIGFGEAMDAREVCVEEAH